MKKLFLFFTLSMMLFLVYGSSPVMAQDIDPVEEEKLKSTKTAETKDGWHFRFKPSSNFNLADNRKVVGQPEGYSMTFGLNLDLGITLFKGKHEWRNTFLINEAITRTPVIDEFIISTDTFKIESMYLYYFYDWFGLYGRLAMDTSMFPSYDVQPAQSTYAITGKDGTIDFLLDDKVKLTGPFAPFTLKEGFGPFFRPLAKEEINLEFLLGLGFWQTWQNGELTVSDDGDTAEIEVKTLQNVYQIGGESINRMWGELWTKRIAYLLAAELMMPFYVDPDVDPTGADRLNVFLNARLDLRFTEWMSIGYELKAIREPMTIEEWQLQNNLLITLSYSLYEHLPY